MTGHTQSHPTAEPVRRCKHDVSEDCPACAEETIASLKIQLKDWQDSSEAYRADCERGNAALRKTEAALSKVVGWLGRLATASEQRAKDNRFPSLADANAADAKNYRSTIVSIMPALEAARAALPQSSTPARPPTEPGYQALLTFLKWAMQEGPWEGDDLYGADVQDKAESLGLIVKTKYDPAKHGDHPDFEEGADFYEIAAGLAIPSTSRATGPLVPWELKCRREVCAAPECDCPAASTPSKTTED